VKGHGQKEGAAMPLTIILILMSLNKEMEQNSLKAKESKLLQRDMASLFHQQI
jgi:hypothetical protein